MPTLHTIAPRKKAALKSKSPSKTSKKNLGLPQELLLQMHDLMVQARVLEERLIKIYKAGDSFFWIGSPGEEAFGVPLGLLANKGQGIKHDYFHLHYRCTPTLMALGMKAIDAIRLNMNRATDPCAGGRNFSGHYCFPQWNVVPVSSPIEVQYTMATGTAHVQKQNKSKAITIVTGGDAGTAEGDFASCLVWASRPGNELPMLITVQNNLYGISTTYGTQHGEKNIADRGKAFGIRTNVINGNDPIESYLQLKSEMEYIRKTGKPVLLEAHVSRLRGHSSATGANLEPGDDCLLQFESKLLKAGLISEKRIQELWQQYETEYRLIQDQVQLEPVPTAESTWDHVYANNENGDWRKF